MGKRNLLLVSSLVEQSAAYFESGCHNEFLPENSYIEICFWKIHHDLRDILIFVI